MTVLVGVADLADQLAGDSPPVLLDVRWTLGDPDGYRHYLDGHLPGAVYVDLDTELADRPSPGRGRHPLPEVTALQAAARRWGIRSDRGVVCYDATGNLAAARAWWLLRWAGLDDVRLLDGGLAAWSGAQYEVAQHEVAQYEVAQHEVARFEMERGEPGAPAEGDVILRPGGRPVLTADDAARWPRDGVLLDARAAVRFRGEHEPIDQRPGHIPGALNAPTSENLAADGTFLPAAELRARFTTVGATAGGAPVAVYCGSGVTAAHEVAALAIAGVDAALYPGSWSEWSADPDRPAAVGA